MTDHCNAPNKPRLTCTILLRTAFLLLCLQFWTLTGMALDPQKKISQYTHDVWQTQDGLPQSNVQVISQTLDGYLWFGTDEGLVRFDGVRFTVFDSVNTP